MVPTLGGSHVIAAGARLRLVVGSLGGAGSVLPPYAWGVAFSTAAATDSAIPSSKTAALYRVRQAENLHPHYWQRMTITSSSSRSDGGDGAEDEKDEEDVARRRIVGTIPERGHGIAEGQFAELGSASILELA
mmetsp:Transcript_3035/g.7900  ORF Transcript_3035/g.7900 Transcript_3035/m.7900 type:complete len:133 (-) Transcript_3035:705-1103(-)